MPADAFDTLYVRTGGPLVYQVMVLTGSRRLAFEAVDAAFHRAWEHWPEVAVDPDPAGWVRARACEYALAPWHRIRPAHQAGAPTEDAEGDPLWRAFLALPAHHRRVLLLCEGLGLTTEQAATEMEATTGATRNRLTHARTTLSRHLPGRDDPGVLETWLKDRATASSTATLPRAQCVRRTSERLTRRQTRLVLTMTATLAALIALTCATTGDDNPSGTSQQVGGHASTSDSASRGRPDPHTQPHLP
ncbi:MULTISPECIES: RNA polymerase sigma factor [Streptomyces]|uniref:RNA polymerase sigma factor n=1 Tax=Streptomyces TaxID=1883 RepID=UPI003720C8D1